MTQPIPKLPSACSANRWSTTLCTGIPQHRCLKLRRDRNLIAMLLIDRPVRGSLGCLELDCRLGYAIVSSHALGERLEAFQPRTVAGGRVFAHWRAIALAILLLAWPWIGVVGHDPWKPDEAYTFGLVYSYLQGGELLVPTLAGSPFMEKPPLFYWAATASARLFSGWLLLPDAARVVVVAFVYLTLGFLAATARVLFGPGRTWMAPILFVGALGLFDKVHMLVTDVGLLAGLSMGLFGLAAGRRHPLGAGSLLGVGVALAFMCKGLLGPGVVALSALTVLAVREYRSPAMLRCLLVAAGVSVPLMVGWPIALYLRSPALFEEWLWINNFGRFFGFVHLGHRREIWFYPVTLLWFSFPLWPLAMAALIRQLKPQSSDPRLLVPLATLLATLAILMLSADGRTLYALPLLLPLTLLAVAGLEAVPAAASHALQRSTVMASVVLVGTLWLAWIAVVTQPPDWLANVIESRAPGFSMPFSVGFFCAALLGTMVWALAIGGRREGIEGALKSWAAGITISWLLIMTLWMPALDFLKSYQAEVASLRRALPTDPGCVASARLGEPARAMLHYYADLITRDLRLDPTAANCDYVIVQVGRNGLDADSVAGLHRIWRGSRAGDRKEALELYRRSGRAAGSATNNLAPMARGDPAEPSDRCAMPLMSAGHRAGRSSRHEASFPALTELDASYVNDPQAASCVRRASGERQLD